ncbi:MAG: PilZ domain-containing protein [Myxococcales bacterium]|nr:PilZ domain-containing protein [Myxococcales bacterium]
MSDGKDRRKYQRIDTDQVISFGPASAGQHLAVSKDVSVGGIRFEVVGCEIDLGETLRVTFNVGEETVVAVAKVVWATELDAMTTDVGMEFVEIDPAALDLLTPDEEAVGF